MIRLDLYKCLGIPEEIQFRQTIINQACCIELIDDRYCITPGSGNPLPADESLFDLLNQNNEDRSCKP